MKMKRGIAVWYNILFYCNVHSLNYISAAINTFRWKRRGSGVWYPISSYCKYSEGNCSSQGELTDVIKYAALSRITGLVSSRTLEFTPQVELAKSELQRTNSEICILGIEKHQQVWGKNKFLGQIVPGNFGGKVAYIMGTKCPHKYSNTLHFFTLRGHLVPMEKTAYK